MKGVFLLNEPPPNKMLRYLEILNKFYTHLRTCGIFLIEIPSSSAGVQSMSGEQAGTTDSAKGPGSTCVGTLRVGLGEGEGDGWSSKRVAFFFQKQNLVFGETTTTRTTTRTRTRTTTTTTTTNNKNKNNNNNNNNKKVFGRWEQNNGDDHTSCDHVSLVETYWCHMTSP